ncbi:hypothetical protein DPMN_059954 [Dreissena polymorpha]|uniref:Uncharacterized protein n=1 Tax=Dreissena polymorpha TaxID=45954 RepID=A0A9D4C4U8_DREPO|nr:hypothetical protein DPMN_059954 [Dreissena polymorpha]
MCPPHRDTDGSRLTLGPLAASNVSCLLRHRLPSPTLGPMAASNTCQNNLVVARPGRPLSPIPPSLKYGSCLPNRLWWWPLPHSPGNLPLGDACFLHPPGNWDLFIENNPSP